MAVTDGQLSKMSAVLAGDGKASYQMLLGEHRVDMAALMGKRLRFEYAGEIFCQHCQRRTKKSFSGGFCFPCSQKLAQCDLCFMKPETCHFDQGTCREPDWGQAVCMQPHVVYLANSSGLKVGITRTGQIPTRWIDQGATQALPIFMVQSRQQSGLVETVYKQHVSDRTDWRKMLKAQAEPLDLAELRDQLFAETLHEIKALQERFGEQSIKALKTETVTEIVYPVLQYPDKVKSLSFDKTTQLEGELLGIKGQYLILDTGVINIRKFTGYHIKMEFAA